MAGRHFSRAEAEALLPSVRPLAERLARHERAAAAARARRNELALRVAGNGGGLDAREVAALDERIAEEIRGVARCANAIHELGGVVKDASAGLVDFPTVVDGEEAYLCWRLGEERIEHWHGLEEGFAGRKPLDP